MSGLPCPISRRQLWAATLHCASVLPSSDLNAELHQSHDRPGPSDSGRGFQYCLACLSFSMMVSVVMYARQASTMHCVASSLGLPVKLPVWVLRVHHSKPGSFAATVSHGQRDWGEHAPRGRSTDEPDSRYLSMADAADRPTQGAIGVDVEGPYHVAL